uniref:Vegetative-specific protein H5 n=1 Tax=Talaromyces marneffei PM1 TaxID=1077442 RepID=A0A093X848_TALMA
MSSDSLYINPERWLRRRRTVETSKIDQTIQACHPQLKPALEKIHQEPYEVTTEEQLRNFRERANGSNAQSVLNEYHAQYSDSHLEHYEWSFNREGYTIDLSIFRPSGDGPVGGRPCVYYIHGGGFIFGSRWSGMKAIIPLIHDHNAICVTVEYRLAPEYKAPTQLEDCFHGLVEVWKQRDSIGINDRLLLVGRSAGAALAVGVALRVRDSKDEEKPQICGQILSFPMLDHTSKMASGEFPESPAWTLHNNISAWQWYLGNEKERTTIYSLPGTAGVQDLVGLPPTLIDIAEVDCLCTEAQHFGEKLKVAKNDVEIMPWKGLFHCGDWALQGQQDLYLSELKFRSVWARRCLGTS